MIRYAALSMFVLASTAASAETVGLSTFLLGSYATNGAADTQVDVGQFPLTSTVTDNAGTHYVEVDGVNTADANGNFFFQNGGVGTGWSSGTSSSILFATITNNSRTAADLQLDSQITPGHLAARYVGGAIGQAQFNFGVLEYDANNQPIGSPLYGANATLDLKTLALTSASATFNSLNGLRETHVGDAIAYDWSATNIAIDLGTFAGGQTRFFQYQLSSGVFVDPGPQVAGPRVPVCNGVQVSFGDPRTRGTSGGGAANVVAAARRFQPNGRSLPNAADCDAGRVNPFIGLPFGPYSGPLITVVAGGSPITQPTPDGPVNYSVPEPATLSLFGLGALGLFARRRRG